YIGGSLLAAYMLLHLVPGGWPTIASTAGAAGKFRLFSFKLDFTVPFTFWAGLLGGTFLTMASHGTDQLLVQRLLTCRNKRDSQKAIILSGFVVFLQFTMFYSLLGINSNRDCNCLEKFHQVGTQYGAHNCVAAIRRDAGSISARRADQARESTRRDDWYGGRAGGDVVCVAQDTAGVDLVRFDRHDYLFIGWLPREFNNRANEISGD